MKYLIGNWKMNPLSVEDAVDLASEIDRGVEDLKNLYIGLAVPSLFLSNVKSQLLDVALGAQNVYWEQGTGAYTGEVSSQQLLDLGVNFVILGHSERRIYLEETDAHIARKVETALKSGLKVVLCIGEPSKVREEGIDAAKEYVADQLAKDLSLVVGSELSVEGNLIIAYEPIWAISTFEGSKPADPTDAEEMIRFIKKLQDERYNINTPVIYGGSTNSENIAGFLNREDIDGALPGSASLSAEEFVEMAQIASRMKTE